MIKEVQYDYGTSIKIWMPNETNDDLSFLDKHMNSTLRTQADAISAIRSNQYVIGSVSATGDFSMAPSPNTHPDASTARIECKRLASQNPGKMFHFFRLCGAELVPTNSVSI